MFTVEPVLSGHATKSKKLRKWLLSKWSVLNVPCVKRHSHLLHGTKLNFSVFWNGVKRSVERWFTMNIYFSNFLISEISMHLLTCKHSCSNILSYHDSIEILFLFLSCLMKDDWHLAKVWKLYVHFLVLKLKISLIFLLTCVIFIFCGNLMIVVN